MTCQQTTYYGKSDVRNPEKMPDGFSFAFHKETEGLSEEEISDAIRFYKQMKKSFDEKKK